MAAPPPSVPRRIGASAPFAGLPWAILLAAFPILALLPPTHPGGIAGATPLEAQVPTGFADATLPGGPSVATRPVSGLSAEESVAARARETLELDFAALRIFRPGHAFWQHVFLIPDGSIAYGSNLDGRLLAVFPTQRNWSDSGRWEEDGLAQLLRGASLPANLTQRRERVAELLEPTVGPVLHNATRGRFLLPNAQRYGAFLAEWGAIYERFGVPAEIGLAQAILESGLNGTVRSEARAVGFCQWLERNWDRMKRHAAPVVIEGHNQTTQAPYCAAYLAVLTTKYGSLVPALSEHHAGGTNVGRTIINGARLGGSDMREQYFLGSELARDLRAMAPGRYSDVVRTYGPRSFRYAEMVFGNTWTVQKIVRETPQEPIHAMRAQRNIPLEEVTRRTGLSADQVRRYNPALVRQVPRGANLYLPMRVEEFGPDATFWQRPMDPAYAALLDEFLRLQVSLEYWDDAPFQSVLDDFRTRFRATATEEGAVMAAVLGYVMDEARGDGRPRILAEFRTSPRVQQLFQEGVRERERTLGSSVEVR